VKILHISPYSPVPPIFGGALRIFHILRGLARHHEVTFVTFGTNEDRERLELSFGGVAKEIHVVDPDLLVHEHPWLGMMRAFQRSESFYTQYTSGHRMQIVLDQLYERNRYDVTIIEFPQMGKFQIGKDTISILDEHNVEYTNFQRMYKGVKSPARKLLYYREHRKTYREEINVCSKVDAIFATSENDARILDEQVPGKRKFIIPNGVETDYFVPSQAEPDPYSMVFTGTMDYIPNQDAMFYFLDQIFPSIKKILPKAKIYIVGKNPPKALRQKTSNDIIVTGYVEDVRPYTWKASVYVVPLRMGSGTRLKILEGLAMKKAIVTTSIGCEGIDVKNGTDAIIADTPGKFAESVTNLLLNRGDAIRLGANGYELVKLKYDWDVIISSVNMAMSSLVEKKEPRPTFEADSSALEKNGTDNHHDEIDADGQPPIKVLMYHRVVNDNTNLTAYSWNVTVSQFRRHLELLNKWGYTCINFEDYSLYQQGKLSLPKKPIIITFDDGYEGVYENAFPIMKEFGARSIAFVLGNRSIKTNFWDEPSGFEGAPLMNDDKILRLKESGFEIGSHSMAHPYLTRLSKRNAWIEIKESKDVLEELINYPVTSFAYPFGASDPQIENMVREAGYQYGCGVYSGPPKFGQNRYDIRRIPILRKTNSIDFALKILTPFEYYEWIKWEASQLLHGLRTKDSLQDDLNKEKEEAEIRKDA